MTIEFPLENVIMLIGAAQGVLISALILQKHYALYANRFLAAMMIALAMILIHLTVEDLGWFSHIRFVFPILFGIPLAVPPLLYLYAEYLANRSDHFPIIKWLHFLPSSLAAALTYGLIFASPAYHEVFLEQSNMDRFPPFFLAFNWIIIIQGAAYIALVFITIGRYERRIKQFYSSIDAIQLRWLRNISLFLTFAWLTFVVENSFVTFGIAVSHFIISSVLVAIYLLVLGYLGLLKSSVLESSVQPPKIGRSELEASSSQNQQTDQVRYKKSGLSSESAHQYRDALLKLMERDKPFLHTDLTLLQLAEALGISPHNLSEVINTQLKKSFYEFINSYRVEQVKKDLSDPAKQHLKILSIAFDAGFNSKASFNTIFKQFTSLTPSEYRMRVTKSVSA